MIDKGLMLHRQEANTRNRLETGGSLRPSAVAYAEMQISEYQAKMQNAIQKAQIALESAKALGQYTAQLAAGALSAVHVSAGMSASGSVSSSESKSTSTSHNYSY